MPKATQLNLKLENRTGILARLCRDLASGGVNLLALSAPPAPAPKGPIRLLVVNRELAEHVLSEAAYEYEVEEVLFVDIKHRPGALAKTMEKLAAADVEVRYAYATADLKAKTSAVVIAVGDHQLDAAEKLLG